MWDVLQMSELQGLKLRGLGSDLTDDGPKLDFQTCRKFKQTANGVKKWLQQQGKDYEGTVLTDRSQLKERERVQHLACRSPQMEPLDQVIGETWSAFSEAFVSDSNALSMSDTHSKS